MKVGIFSPYFRDLIAGGGEKHLFEIALVIAAKHQVHILIPKPNVLVEDRKTESLSELRKFYQNFVGKELSSLNFEYSPLMTSANPWQKLWSTSQFDYLLAVTDGSLFFSLAKHNNLHFQVPFINFEDSLLNRIKLMSWQTKNANSHFTKQLIEKNWRTKVQYVVHPLINTNDFDAQLSEKKVILSVGRFFRQLHSKKQELLIEAFANLREKQPNLMKGWKLVLVGSVEDRAYFRQLKLQAKDLPVEFKTRVNRRELVRQMNEARIFWHAAGFGVSPSRHPEQLEHFGIATAEAMAAGCIPLVYMGGGQKEVLGRSLKDLGWSTIEELLTKTTTILKSQKLEEQWRDKAVSQVKKFGRSEFEKAVWQMFDL